MATLVEMIGDDHVRSLSQSRVAEYRALLLALPRSYGKGQHDKETPLAECLERAKKMRNLGLPQRGAPFHAVIRTAIGATTREPQGCNTKPIGIH